MQDLRGTRNHLIPRGGTVRRITKAALGGFAGFALIIGAAQVANADLEAKYWFRDTLTDLLTADGPFDSAKAKITIAEKTKGTTTFRIRIRGIDPSIAGTTLGSHLHTGPCVEGDFGTPAADGVPAVIPGAQAGPHYNNDVATGHTPVTIGPDTEVWFGLVPDEEGIASDETTVPFVPTDADGVMSVVVHVLPTNPNDGKAGDRQACFPLSVPQWVPAATE
jgi:Cu/Zn superoxide dismutase